MRQTYKWSDFCLKIRVKDGTLLKNGLTGAVIVVDAKTEKEINHSILNGKTETLSARFQELAHPDVAILVPKSLDECSAWRERLVNRRDNDAHIFILHFMPTIQCQLRCDYCVEKGVNRGIGMKQNVVGQSRSWVAEYFDSHPDIDSFRFVLFGGEPLLQKKIAEQAIETFHKLSSERNISFWTEIVTNGEFLDEDTARMFSKHIWRRVQITLDGPEDVHNSRRHGGNDRPTFQNIMRNIKMLLLTDLIPKVDIRISLDLNNADRVPELIRYIAEFGAQDRINLSIGLITPTFASPVKMNAESAIAEKALVAWKVAKEFGFTIPEEFLTGPWCVAIAKHSAVLQPDGSLQKCFCTAGRKEHNFGSIFDKREAPYLKDQRYEHFKRTDQCIAEKCQFIPLCGGGCIHNAMVEQGGSIGGKHRYCQKTLLDKMNHGLLALTYG
jgi:uncharacterized protein